MRSCSLRSSTTMSCRGLNRNLRSDDRPPPFLASRADPSRPPVRLA
jgi:hypothetical protein